MEPKCVPFPEFEKFEKLDTGLMLAIRELSLDAIRELSKLFALSSKASFLVSMLKVLGELTSDLRL